MNQNKYNKDESDIYWSKIFNRIERAVGWFFFVTGLIILVSYVLYQFVLMLFEDSHLSLFIKTGIFFIMIGFVVLLFSIIREKIILSRKDKYSEIEQ